MITAIWGSGLLAALVVGTLIVNSSAVAISPAPNQRQQETAEKRLTVPSEDEQKEAREKITNLLKEAYQDRSPTAVRSRAQEFLKTAVETDDAPVDQYTLLDEAMKAAVSIGDVETVLSICTELDSRFQIDPVQLRLTVIKNISNKLTNLDSANQLLAAMNLVAKKLVAKDDYENATRLIDRMVVVARKGKLEKWYNYFKTQSGHVKKLAGSFDSLETHFFKLNDDADDAKANQAIGEFYCFEKADWKKGRPRLTLGTNESIKQIVDIESRADLGKTEKLEVANFWWDFASDLPTAKQESVLRHAFSYYRECSEDVQGLDKLEITKRIRDFGVRFLSEEVRFIISNEWLIQWDHGPRVEVRFLADGTYLANSQPSNTKYVGTWVEGTEQYTGGVWVQVAGRKQFFYLAQGSLMGVDEQGDGKTPYKGRSK